MPPATAPAKPRPAPTPDTQQPRLWNVVLLDDQDHTYDYVIRLATELFAHSPERAFEIAKTVDAQGRAVLMTTHKELAELKRDQVHAFGKDPLIARCAGAMSAVIEPAFGDDDPDKNDPAKNDPGNNKPGDDARKDTP